ncbi:MAG: DUF305 domain-containing protein [Acidimicrobiia bacterium]|nr:DUF305 domain-containing protein [Acidimicrobiia bacterium]
MNTPTTERAADSDGADVESVSDRAAERFYRWLIVGLGAGVVAIGLVALVMWLTAKEDQQEPLGEVDIGFMQDMLDHHDQALVLSEAYLEDNPDGDAAPYANEVIMFQTRDIGRMEEWLAEDGRTRGTADRMAMTWMPMAEPTPVAEMHGMQPPDSIAELAAATGPNADALFFELMTAHHLGGVMMANHAAEHGESEFLRVFAAGVSRNQLLEVDEYDGAIRRLGL